MSDVEVLDLSPSPEQPQGIAAFRERLAAAARAALIEQGIDPDAEVE